MKRISVLFVAFSLGLAAQAQPVIVDDLSDGSLSEYTLSRVNDANGTAHVSFDSTGGDLRAAYTGTPNAHEQVLLLRDDFTLGVGYMLVADVHNNGGGWDRDIGIAVGYSETPPALAPGASGDARTSYVEVSFRGNNQVVSYARNGTANLTSGQEFAGTTYGGASFTGFPDFLYIARLTTTEFEVGWMDHGISHALTLNGTLFNPYSITTDTPGAAVGFYGDVRAAIAMSPSGIDNLRIEVIPEPSTFALLGLGFAALLIRSKRA